MKKLIQEKEKAHNMIQEGRKILRELHKQETSKFIMQMPTPMFMALRQRAKELNLHMAQYIRMRLCHELVGEPSLKEVEYEPENV